MPDQTFERPPCVDCGGITFVEDYGYKRRRPYEMCVKCGRGGADWRAAQANKDLAHRLDSKKPQA